jgi:hypothetical protein
MQVLTVRDILSFGVASHMGARVELEELAMKALSYRLAPGTDPAGVSADDAFYASDAYKRRVLEHMSIAQLIDTLLINPTVDLKPSGRDTGLTAPTWSTRATSRLRPRAGWSWAACARPSGRWRSTSWPSASTS